MKHKLSLVSQVAYQLYTALLEFQKLAAKRRDSSGARGQGGQAPCPLKSNGYPL